MRILAIDHGEKHLGIAISDPTGTIANPLTVITHTSRLVDAATVARLALEQEAGLIVVGLALGDEGEETPQSRKAGRFAQALRLQTSLPIELWDESGSTQAARESRIAMGVSRRKRRGHLDDLAATVILQTYLDTHPQ
jgi:putative Holliday junction resolvase